MGRRGIVDRAGSRWGNFAEDSNQNLYEAFELVRESGSDTPHGEPRVIVSHKATKTQSWCGEWFACSGLFGFEWDLRIADYITRADDTVGNGWRLDVSRLARLSLGAMYSLSFGCGACRLHFWHESFHFPSF